MKKAGKPVFTSESALWKYYDFMVTGHRAGCMAGERFLVVNPDGRLTPCAMVMAYYDDQESMRREFTCNNTCGACYISTRANAEKGPRDMFFENLEGVRNMVSRS